MTDIPQVVTGFLRMLDSLGASYMIGGSFASSLWGLPRQTNDLDVEVILSDENGERLFILLGDDYVGSVEHYREAVQEDQEFASFQLLHVDALFKIDVFLSPKSEYRDESFQRSTLHEMYPGVSLRFKSAEDTIITKLRWFELGGRVSDRQWNDIVQVLEAQLPTLETDYMKRWCQHFGVAALLEDAVTQITSND